MNANQTTVKTASGAKASPITSGTVVVLPFNRLAIFRAYVKDAQFKDGACEVSRVSDGKTLIFPVSSVSVRKAVSL